MAGDSDLKINFQNIVSGGMKASFAVDRFGDVEDINSQDMIAVHVGSCDFEEGKETNTKDLLGEYFLIIGKLRKECPRTTILISSILPRSSKPGRRASGKGFKELNEQILAFNIELAELCGKLDNVKYVDNYRFSVNEDGSTRDELYRDDIHLFPRGQKMLSDNIFQVIKTTYMRDVVVPELLNCEMSKVLSAPSE